MAGRTNDGQRRSPPGSGVPGPELRRTDDTTGGSPRRSRVRVYSRPTFGGRGFPVVGRTAKNANASAAKSPEITEAVPGLVSRRSFINRRRPLSARCGYRARYAPLVTAVVIAFSTTKRLAPPHLGGTKRNPAVFSPMNNGDLWRRRTPLRRVAFSRISLQFFVFQTSSSARNDRAL